MRRLALLFLARNGAPCVVRVMWGVVFLTLLFLCIKALFLGQALDFASTARAWCEFLVAASVGIAGKALAEPKE